MTDVRAGSVDRRIAIENDTARLLEEGAVAREPNLANKGVGFTPRTSTSPTT